MPGFVASTRRVLKPQRIVFSSRIEDLMILVAAIACPDNEAMVHEPY